MLVVNLLEKKRVLTILNIQKEHVNEHAFVPATNGSTVYKPSESGNTKQGPCTTTLEVNYCKLFSTNSLCHLNRTNRN